ncbi:DEAD-box helicase Dbp80 [Tetranychus urticae]|uniref:DEAD-box helicase Dbp80 n=1 Tax=Tetranychus urticae TaxID=32264 RepID=UPI00077B8641|nr:DEAD-box helicase Dbp80 [Tetranychus urticae]
MAEAANPSDDGLVKKVEEVSLKEDNRDDDDETVDLATLSLMRKLTRNRILESKSNEVEVTRANPNSPLHSVKSFEELNLPEGLLKGIYEMGFSAPSKIQETVLPILLSNPPTNIIAQSQSGTGKTAAFLLSSLARVDDSLNYPQVLILSPTYELALQTGQVAEFMAKHKKTIKFKYVVRGVELHRDSQIQEHVILGTPGKVMDAALRYRCFDIRKIRVLVLDEADVMIDTQGHRNQSIRIKNALSSNCQIMFFSATYEGAVMEFAEQIVKDPVIIRLKKEEESLENIEQFYVLCNSDVDKYKALANLFGTLTIGQVFIFCQTKKAAAWLTDKLRKDGHSVGIITGDLTVEERTEVINRFRDGVERVLIATNLMARGIDVDQVTVVINYDLPIDITTKDIDFETYLHRIGRTGRFGKSGLAINMVDSQRTLEMIKKLEQHYGREISMLDANDLDRLEELNKES